MIIFTTVNPRRAAAPGAGCLLSFPFVANDASLFACHGNHVAMAASAWVRRLRRWWTLCREMAPCPWFRHMQGNIGGAGWRMLYLPWPPCCCYVSHLFWMFNYFKNQKYLAIYAGGSRRYFLCSYLCVSPIDWLSYSYLHTRIFFYFLPILRFFSCSIRCGEFLGRKLSNHCISNINSGT